MHADDSLFSSMTGWVSRNISTIGICIGFGTVYTAFNEYRNRKNSDAMMQQIRIQKPVCHHNCSTQEQVDPLVEKKVTSIFEERDSIINTWIDSMNTRMSDLFRLHQMHRDDTDRQMPAIAKNVYDQEQAQAMKKLLSLPQTQNLIRKQPSSIKNYTDLTHMILLSQNQRINALEQGKFKPMQHKKQPLNNNFTAPQSDLSSSSPL
jgi:hypothetical protein